MWIWIGEGGRDVRGVGDEGEGEEGRKERGWMEGRGRGGVGWF